MNIKELVIKYRRIVIYTLVGAANTAVDFFVFTLLAALTDIDAGVNQSVGYCAGILCSFVLNRGLTFKKGATTRLPVQIVRFIAVNGVSLLISTKLITMLVDNAGLNEYAAKCIVTLVTMVINYAGYKMFVFSVKDNEKSV